MTTEDRYEAWRRTRADADVPDEFTDRVMAGVRAVVAEQPPVAGLAALAASGPFRLLAASIAIVVFAVRVVSALSIFVES